MFFGVEQLCGMGVDANIKLPKPIIEASKAVPGLVQALPLYARRLEQAGAKAQAQSDSWNTTIQSIAVAGVFGLVIAALLSREKKR